ncbi:MAG TPA: TIGR03857 family LLM class F420-dependent oxidoreductase [Mycobacteriales bacterium]|nr:TIGR03857 family LLM class F420-dependent oxidoreductase [Mycobacteriales bacterium]
MTTDTSRLGAYVLPGRSDDPALAVRQAVAGEQAGLGAVWLSERFGTKDVATVGAAMAAATERVSIGAGITHLQTRHPLALASLGLTMQALSGGRFLLGIGRSIPVLMKAWGLPRTTNQLLIDGADVLRRLWAGERVKYDGPLGTFPSLQLVDRPAVAPPPLLLAGIGPVTVALAGAHYDGVILHPFLTVEAQQRTVEVARAAAQEAGRDADALRVIATVVVAADQTADEIDMRVRARLVTYLSSPGLGPSLVAANGWDASVLAAIAEHPLVAPLGRRPADGALDHAQLIEVSRVIPEAWFEQGAAFGSGAHCARRIREHLDAGASDLILHGSTPDLLGPLVDEVSTAQH